MRFRKVCISGGRHMDVELPWASAMVLFGPNDSGKTNILEDFVWGIGMKGARKATRGGRAGELTFEVELDGIDIPGHPDGETFVSWFLSWSVPVSWPGLEDLRDYPELRRAWLDLQYAYADNLPQGEGRGAGVAQLAEGIRKIAAAYWDLRAAAGAVASEHPAPRSGEVAVASHVFRVSRREMSWLASDGQVIAAGGEPDPDEDEDAPGIDTYTEDLDVQAVWLDPLAGSTDPVRDSVEAAVLGLASDEFRHLDEALPEVFQGDPMDVFAWVDFHSRARAKLQSWIIQEGDSFRLRPSVREACAFFSQLVGWLAPAFVSDSYDVRVVPLFPDEWAQGHVAVHLRARSGDEEFDPEMASSGIRTWLALAIREAARTSRGDMSRLIELWRESSSSEIEGSLPEQDQACEDSESAPAAPHSTWVYVIDEPETHLHPLAQEQAAEWLALRARVGAHVLMATHAVPFLRLPLEDVEYIQVTRNENWETRARPVTDDIFLAVAESADTLGLSPVALIQLTRGWLIVEGAHDRRILDAFCGRDLRRAGIQVLPLRGAARAKASFVALEALKPLRLPFFYLLDNTYAGGQEQADERQLKTEEEKIAEQLKFLAQEEGTDLRLVSWPYPDIICALPIEAVRRLAAEKKGKPDAATSWSDLIERHERSRTQALESGAKPCAFKTFVLDEIGLTGRSPDWFVDEVLRRCEERPPDGCPLVPLVSGVIASLDQRPEFADEGGVDRPA